MAAFGTFSQRVIDLGARLRGLSRASLGALGLICAGGPAADAANFTCSWNDATANWTTVADWSNCNSTFPNNGGGNTFDATIAQGNPTLTTHHSPIGSVTITSPGAWEPHWGSRRRRHADSGGRSARRSGLANSGSMSTWSGDGGGSLTIGGTLNNTKTVQLGSRLLPMPERADHALTLGGLTQPERRELCGYRLAEPSGDLGVQPGGSGFSQHDGGALRLSTPRPLTLNNPLSPTAARIWAAGTAALTVAGNFANSGALNVDAGSGDGGGSLTIGGTLNNTKAVQVGTDFADAARDHADPGRADQRRAARALRFSARRASGDLGVQHRRQRVHQQWRHLLLSDTTPLTLNTAFTNSGTSFGLPGTAALTVTGNFANSGVAQCRCRLGRWRRQPDDRRHAEQHQDGAGRQPARFQRAPTTLDPGRADQRQRRDA